MQIGKITKLCHDQKYGSIRAKTGEEVHFHQHCLWDVVFDELVDGQEVEFEVELSHQGRLGFHIRPSVKNKLLEERSKWGKVKKN